MENNTVVDNTGGIYLARYTTSLPTVKNNIVVGNDIGVEDYGSSTDPTWQYNDVYGNGTNYLGIDDPTGTQGNISADPLFQGASTDDWSLQPTSRPSTREEW